MPSFKTYNYPTIMSLYAEAIRDIPGYNKCSPEREVKALINYVGTKDNTVLIANDCMILNGKRYKKKSQFLEKRYCSLLGKQPRKDAAACSIVFTLPKDFLVHDIGLTEAEYIALQKYNEAADGCNLDSHEMDLVNSAKNKITHIKWTTVEKEKITEYFQKAVHSLCKICGIKETDILYAVVHMDESFPHLHFAFMPMEYGKATYNEAKEDALKHGLDINKLKAYSYNGNTIKFYREMVNGVPVEKFHGLIGYMPKEEEQPCGCGIKRFKKSFLHELNNNLEKEMHLLGIDTKISTGKGQKFKVADHSKKLREEQVILTREMEFQKQQIEQLETLEASTQLQLMRYENAFSKLKADIEGLVESTRSILVLLINDTVEKFIPLWKEAKINKERIDEQAINHIENKATNIITNRFTEIENSADKLVNVHDGISSKITSEQKEIIKKKIQMLAKESGRYKLEQAFIQQDIIEYCYRRYLDTDKDRQYLNDNYIHLSSPEAQEYMRSTNRIRRAFDEVIEAVTNEPEKFDDMTVKFISQYISVEEDREQEYNYR